MKEVLVVMHSLLWHSYSFLSVSVCFGHNLQILSYDLFGVQIEGRDLEMMETLAYSHDSKINARIPARK